MEEGAQCWISLAATSAKCNLTSSITLFLVVCAMQLRLFCNCVVVFILAFCNCPRILTYWEWGVAEGVGGIHCGVGGELCCEEIMLNDLGCWGLILGIESLLGPSKEEVWSWALRGGVGIFIAFLGLQRRRSDLRHWEPSWASWSPSWELNVCEPSYNLPLIKQTLILHKQTLILINQIVFEPS